MSANTVAPNPAADRFLFERPVPKRAQQELLEIWLSLPKPERDDFFYTHLFAQGTPEDLLADWKAKHPAADGLSVLSGRKEA